MAIVRRAARTSQSKSASRMRLPPIATRLVSVRLPRMCARATNPALAGSRLFAMVPMARAWKACQSL